MRKRVGCWCFLLWCAVGLAGCGVTSSQQTLVPSATHSVQTAPQPPQPNVEEGVANPGQTTMSLQPTVSSSPLATTVVPEQSALTPDTAAEQQTTMNPTPSHWQSYNDTTFGFSLEYPDSYAPLSEAAPFANNAPDLLYRVRFVDKDLIGSDTADLEVPQFAIEIFNNRASRPLDQWIDSHSPPNATRTHVQIGNLTAYKVELATLMAPGQFYYVEQGTAIYRLTPLGPYSDRMLTSFKLSLP